jgi:hypothetical protein
MEVVRLTNEKASRDEYVRFLEEENKSIERETREEFLMRIGLMEQERDSAIAKAGMESRRADMESERADMAEKRADAAEAIISEKDQEIFGLNGRLLSLEPVLEIADAAKAACMNSKDIINVINRRMFQRNSDATRFLNDEIDPNTPYLEESPISDVIRHVMQVTDGLAEDTTSDSSPQKKDKACHVPSKKRSEVSKENAARILRSRRQYSASVLERIGIDTSDLPAGAKLIRRKDKACGEDVWYVKLFFHTNAKVTCREYKIGRFNVPGNDPVCSKHPGTILENNPVMPSFARFYLDSKFNLNLSENRIIEMLKGMKTDIPQSSLNLWMHRIMEALRVRLEPLMLEAIRQSKYTNNDGTRLLVRSRETKDMPFKYNIEYIQAALSLEKKLVVMLYDEGTRDHTLQEEKIFKGSSIKGFICDRAPQYTAIVNDLPEMNLVRQACWFHGRHYLVDAYLVDHRMEDILILINTLFYIERVFKQEDDQSPEARRRFRIKWSLPIVTRIMKKLEAIRAAGKEYGEMVHRAVDYILNDKEAFLKFLQDGNLDMHNIAIERCFRHIAMGRRNWLHSGSHFAAQNIAFMFGLLESCKLNNINFGEYIEDILTRILFGEQADESFLPCNYESRHTEGEDAA